jgi:hypothetical protein|tara:strand:- start:321 stop:524 length:204 start_codon:yes stop_codon:yes gene_type:complete
MYDNEAKKMMGKASATAKLEAAFGELADELIIANLVASCRRLHYDASIKKGFTPEQALVLCQKRSLG